MDFGEIIVEGLSTMVIGMSIVVLALAAIAVLISLLKYIGVEKKAQQAAAPSAPVQAAAPAAPEPEPAPVAVPEQDDAALIAAITAAVAACMNTSSDRLRVVSFRRAGAWSAAAKREQQNSGF